MRGSAMITTIVATSPIPCHPDIKHLRRTIDSLKFVPLLDKSRILVVFDFPREQQNIEAYEAYKVNVRDHYKDKKNVECLYLEEWGHLSGVMRCGLSNVSTPFIFAQQHDLPLLRGFDIEKVLECIENDDNVKHVRFNTRHHVIKGRDRAPLEEYPNPYVPLTSTGGWSDQTHITTAQYYADVVFPEIGGRNVPVEAVLDRLYHTAPPGEVAPLHARLGTFLYGTPRQPPMIEHTDGRKLIWRNKAFEPKFTV